MRAGLLQGAPPSSPTWLNGSSRALRRGAALLGLLLVMQPLILGVFLSVERSQGGVELC